MTRRLIQLDRAHLWHPFTPMKRWCDPAAGDPLVIERGEGFELIDTDGRRYIDGVSSLWCNVHGHRVPEIDHALRQQLDKIAHSTLLGLASPPSIELAARLIDLISARLKPQASPLTRIFYSDAGSTAVEAAMKMAVGYWYHTGKPLKRRFIALDSAYHGDTTGSMSVGYSDFFHRPFQSMVFETRTFGLERPALADLLAQHADETAAVILEPVMQGAAGMIAQPPGFVKQVRQLCTAHHVLMIADEVATGFGRTGKMFACEHDLENFRGPDLMCLAKGLTGGYLPLAATLATEEIFNAFLGDTNTFFHGHTYTGNALACAAALASLDLFEKNNVLENVRRNSAILHDKTQALRQLPGVKDIRQRGVMMGIELKAPAQQARDLCLAMRSRGLILRPLGNVLVLMPAPAMPPDLLTRMMDIVVETLTAASL